MAVSAVEYRRVLSKMLGTLHPLKKQVLVEMMKMPAQTASVTQLCQRLDIDHIIEINGAIGQLGDMLYRRIGKHPEGAVYGGWSMIATQGQRSGVGFPWKLRPHLVSALLSLNFAVADVIDSNEITEAANIWEGAKLQRWVNAYERSTEARLMCLEHHGYACSACKMTFKQTYGLEFAEFIHVHHLRPLAEIDERYKVDPIKHLLPLCPNCHAVAHYGGQMRTPLEIKSLMSLAAKRRIKH